MGITYTVKMQDVGRYEQRLGAAMPRILERALVNAANVVYPILTSASVPKVRNYTGKFNTGWVAKVEGSDRLHIYNSAAHAPFVEGGRRAGRKAPPTSAMVPWVAKRMGISDPRQLRSVAFLVARAIGQRGIPGKYVLAELWPKLSNIIDMTVRRHVNAAAARLR